MDFISRQYTQLQEKIWAQNKLKLKDDFVFNRLVPPNPWFALLYRRTCILFWNITFIVKGALESRP